MPTGETQAGCSRTAARLLRTKLLSTPASLEAEVQGEVERPHSEGHTVIYPNG